MIEYRQLMEDLRKNHFLPDNGIHCTPEFLKAINWPTKAYKGQVYFDESGKAEGITIWPVEDLE